MPICSITTANACTAPGPHLADAAATSSLVICFPWRHRMNHYSNNGGLGIRDWGVFRIGEERSGRGDEGEGMNWAGDPSPRFLVAGTRARNALGAPPPARRTGGRKNETLGFSLLCLCFYSYGGLMQAARDHGLGRKFKLGRNILSGTIFSRACPKWMNPTEFRPNSVESQNRGCDINFSFRWNLF